MIKIHPISFKTIRNYLLNRSFLGSKSNNLLDVLEFFRCVQIDPIDIVAKSHELVLYNRVHNFQKTDLYISLYQDRDIYEYWLQLFSIIPAKYYQFLTARRQITDQWHINFQSQNLQALNQAKRFIYQNGPTCSLDLSHLTKVKSIFSWSDVKSASGLLDFLWDRGELVIHHRTNNRKYYDFAYRTLGQVIKNSDFGTSRTWILESFFSYTGIVRANFFNRVGYSKTLKLNELFTSMLQSGFITELKIPSIKTKYYCLTSQINQIEKLGSQSIDQLVNFLSPLDPLIIDRQLISDFFNFKYTWEAYMPDNKRKFGYYGMPVMYKGQFIGQIDPKKENSNLRVKNSTLIYPDSESKIIIKKAFRDLESFAFQTNKISL